MDQPSASLRGGAPSASTVDESEAGNEQPARGEVGQSDVGLSRDEEVGEEPRLPSEPCFAKPAPWWHRVKQAVGQLSTAAAAVVTVLQSLAGRDVSGLRGSPGPTAPGVEETSPVGHLQADGPAIASLDSMQPEGVTVLESPSSGADDPVVGSATGNDPSKAQVAGAEEGENGDRPQLPKEPCYSRDKSTSSGLKKLLLKAAAAASAGGLLLRGLGERGLGSIGILGTAAPVGESGLVGSGEQVSIPPNPPSPLDVTPAGNSLPQPAEVVGGDNLA